MKRSSNDLLDTAAILITGMVVILVALLGQGCGASAAQQHRTLNMITDVGDPTYSMALNGCDAARDAIVRRADTTWAEDRLAMDQINAVCDSMVESFEVLRGSQITARAYIEEGLAGAAEAAILEGLSLWRHLQRLVARIADLGRSSEPEYTVEE